MKQYIKILPPIFILASLTLSPRNAHCENGRLYGMGRSHLGQLGIIDSQGINSALLIDAEVRSVAANGTHTLYILNDGTLWGLGGNSSGQLGSGDTLDRSTPFLIDHDVQAVSTSWSHTLYIKRDHTLWGMGANGHGQLGIGSKLNQNDPVQIDIHVKEASAGYRHSLYVKIDGSLWGMGDGRKGRLGLSGERIQAEPVQIDSQVRQAAAGVYHSLYLKENGHLMGMGLSLPGALGTGDNSKYLRPVRISDGVTAVVTSMNTAFFVKSDGSLWGMGENSDGQLGVGDQSNRLSPVCIDSNVIAVAAGDGHALYLKANQSLWGMGSNLRGQLGSGDAHDIVSPIEVDADVQNIAAGSGHSLYVKGWRMPAAGILQPPQSLTVAPGQTATFTVTPTAIPGERYAWSKDGAPVGTDSPQLRLVEVKPSDAGRYQVTVHASGEQVSSRWITLGVRSSPDETQRLMNLSTRGMVQAGAGALIVGFVTEGAEDAQILLRGVGPTLKNFGVPGFLSDPRIDLLNGSNQCLASNEKWGVAADQICTLSEKVGAFPLLEDSIDAAMCYSVTRGVYTVQVNGLNGNGIGLGEVYAVDGPGESCRLKNLSTRGLVGANERVLIAGFVLTGEVPQRILIRGVGPGLASFGVADPLEDPVLEVIKQEEARVEWVASNDDWGRHRDRDRLISATQSAGAFPLKNGSHDAAILTWLEPGSYTATLSGSGGTTGVALVEVYQVGD